MAQHRTPLRYPGGKQRLSPFIDEVLITNEMVDSHYVEPYAGGAGVALELLLANKVGHIHLNDASLHIFAFWNSVLTQSEKLCERILTTSLTIDEWKRHREIVRNPEGNSLLDIGFSTFFLNRCNRSGLLNGGVIGGLEQSGTWKMDARFPRSALVSRIEAIAARRELISIHNLDAEKYIKDYLPGLPSNTLVYCDPPYYEKSDRLYLNRYKKQDHQRIAAMIQRDIKHRWVVSYDAHPEIRRFYEERKSFLYDLQYNATRVYQGKEIFVFSDNLKLPVSSSLKFIDCQLPQSI